MSNKLVQFGSRRFEETGFECGVRTHKKNTVKLLLLILSRE